LGLTPQPGDPWDIGMIVKYRELLHSCWRPIVSIVSSISGVLLRSIELVLASRAAQNVARAHAHVTITDELSMILSCLSVAAVGFAVFGLVLAAVPPTTGARRIGRAAIGIAVAGLLFNVLIA
jgi:hypothetical protein